MSDNNELSTKALERTEKALQKEIRGTHYKERIGTRAGALLGFVVGCAAVSKMGGAEALKFDESFGKMLQTLASPEGVAVVASTVGMGLGGKMVANQMVEAKREGLEESLNHVERLLEERKMQEYIGQNR